MGKKWVNLQKDEVDEAIWKRMQTGQVVVERVRKLLQFGQANQSMSLAFDKRKTNEAFTKNLASVKRYQQVADGWAFLEREDKEETWHVLATGEDLKIKRKHFKFGEKKQIPETIVRPQRVAGIALHKGTGNCQEYASVSYLLLKSYLTKEDAVWYCHGSGNGDHWYCLIVDPEDDQKKSTQIPEYAVVVDPWVTNIGAVAALYEHTFNFKAFPVKTVYKRAVGQNRDTAIEAQNLPSIQSAKRKYTKEMLQLLETTTESGYRGRKPEDFSLEKLLSGGHMFEQYYYYRNATDTHTYKPVKKNS